MPVRLLDRPFHFEIPDRHAGSRRRTVGRSHYGLILFIILTDTDLIYFNTAIKFLSFSITVRK